MPIKFYCLPFSPICRSVMLTAKAVGVELECIPTNSLAGETKTPEFVKMNPQHVIPTINDDGFILWESRAILGYLVQAYAKGDCLYPKDAKKRAVVDQRLYFDMGTFLQRFFEYVAPPAFHGAEKMCEEKKKKVEEAVGFLETFLCQNDYAAGNCITIADHALMATASSMEACGFDFSSYKKVSAWMCKCKENMTGYKDCGDVQAFGGMIKGKLSEKGLKV